VHPLLARQLAKLGLRDRCPTADEWAHFVERIDQTYSEHDSEHDLRLRSHDIAERELIEVATRLETDRDEAVAAATAKGEFLANMSHEIRTPLNGIIGMIELLRGTTLTPEQTEYARAALLSAEALLTVVNDVLDFSKLEAGKVEIEHIDFDLRALIEEMGDILGARAREKDLELVTSLDGRVPRFVRGDPARVRQILLNLTSNAIKFTRRGEVLVQGAPDPESADKSSSDHVDVSMVVQDTGIGIPVERLKSLFQPFTQMDASTTRRFGGTGLGLAISKELVSLMGGRLEVSSEPNVGSRFDLKLRFERGLPGDAEVTPDIRFYGARGVIVDDNRTNRAILMQLFENWGLDAIEAESGAEALDRIEAEYEAGRPVDVAIADFQMPGMNGQQFAKLLRSDDRFRALPIVLATSAPEIRGKLDTTLFSAIVSKPMKQSQLHRGLCTALKRGTQPGFSVTDALDRPALPPGIRVLLVEDNIVNQRVAQRLLEKAGALVDVAGDGAAAVATCRRVRYDVILMDCQMPIMDGYEATERIRLYEPAGTRVPIIALTANASESDRERCKAADMDGYIPKPVRAHELCAAIVRHVTSGARDAAEPEATS
jgi:signal transduction histidine kinase/CheY-like chemotaxis protein